jgi:glycine/D-amino acid oxidase-like deaminating enzyme
MFARMRTSADVVVCGAGIAGIAAAYHLAVRQQVRRVVIVDERDALTLTSNKGTQGYRNWWPGPDDTMLRLVSRSIDLLEASAEESDNVFRMNRRGYLFATADHAQLQAMADTAQRVSSFGMGTLRTHSGSTAYSPHRAEGYAEQPGGADLLLGDDARTAFPYLAPETVAALHIRRAGTLNAVALGTWLLTRAIASGVRFVHDRVVGVGTVGGRIQDVRLASGDVIDTNQFVAAAGPALPDVARMLGVDLPLVHELHAKVRVRDTHGAVPRDAPFVIWNDPMVIDGESLPGGVHMRPVDLTHGDELYLIWTYESEAQPYVWPPTFNPRYADAVIRGCARMIPALEPHIGRLRAGAVTDGGYYCKTPENRPLVGPLPVDGAFVIGALSGFGLMSAHACGELLSQHVTGHALPDYARWFLPSRYDDLSYQTLVTQWGPRMGQL